MSEYDRVPVTEVLRRPQETTIRAAQAATADLLAFAETHPRPDPADKATFADFKDASDAVAVESIQHVLEDSGDTYTIVTCEGGNTNSPHFADGQVIGDGGQMFDAAIDPLDGTTMWARGAGNAFVLIRYGMPGSIYRPSAFGMETVMGQGLEERGRENPFDLPPEELVRRIAQIKGIPESEVVLAFLDRPFLKHYAEAIHRVGGTALEIYNCAETVGGVAACIDPQQRRYQLDPAETPFHPPHVDALIGKVGAPETIVMAGVAKATGASIWVRELDDESHLPKPDVLTMNDLVKGPTGVVIAGIQESPILPGASYGSDGRLTVHTLSFQTF